MKEHVMKLNYAKTFKRIIVLLIVLAVVSAVAVPLSLSQQISDAAALRQEYAAAGADDAGSGHGEKHDREELWKSRITPLGAMNYAVIGGLGVLWAALGVYYWLAVIAWLYKNAVSEGMNKSLWPVLGLFFNVFAVMAFCIVRDRPHCANKAV